MAALIIFSLFVRCLKAWFLDTNSLRIIRFQVRAGSKNRSYFKAAREGNLSGFCFRSPSMSKGNFIERNAIDTICATHLALPDGRASDTLKTGDKPGTVRSCE